MSAQSSTGSATPIGGGLWVRDGGSGGRRVVYGVRDGEVRHVVVAARRVAASPRLRSYLRLAGLS